MLTKLRFVVMVAALGAASPALAQNHDRTPSFGASYGQTLPHCNDAARNGRFNPDSPALTGGGSIGGNRLMHSMH